MNALAIPKPETVRGISLRLSAELIRSGIIEYEAALAAQPNAVFGDNDICPLKHSFAGPLYVREIFIPAGMEIVGKIHRHDHPNFLLSGTVMVVTEEKGFEELTGPLSIISVAGTKRALKAVTDVRWVTVHYVGDERDLKKIEAMVIAPSYSELEETWLG